MKITTAIEFLKEKSRKRRLEEMNELKELLIMCSDGLLEDKNFDIGLMQETDLEINIRDVWFDIDGLELREWLKENCIVNKNFSDFSKHINIIGLK